jgi:carbamate kinase
VRIVVALGGNALLRPGEPLEPDRQRCNIAHAADAVAQLARPGVAAGGALAGAAAHSGDRGHPAVGFLGGYRRMRRRRRNTVTVLASGAVCGTEAVIDKDLCAALLAREVGAQALLLLTDVDAVYADWGTPRAAPIRLRTFTFERGSMAPKIEAACRFIESGGECAGIGLLEDAAAILADRRGTLVRPAASRKDRQIM